MMFSRKTLYVVRMAVVVGGTTVLSPVYCNEEEKINVTHSRQREYHSDLSSTSSRVYSPEEVQLRDGTDGKPLWVSYRGDVFDVTKFREVHPGGKFIEKAAGYDVEPFWKKWASHFESKAVKKVLVESKIGRLSKKHEFSDEDEYIHDPPRESQRDNHDFVTLKPALTQTHPFVLGQHFLTPSEALYIRNHANVPRDITADTCDVCFSLACNGSNQERQEKMTLPLTELEERFGTKDVVSVLQCAGNRQADDFHNFGPNGFSGTPLRTIKSGMIGNIRWTGIPLERVLRSVYPRECNEEMRSPGSWHVIFTGADEYESSVPLELLLDESLNGLLATKMNSEALPPDHGYPVRVVLPGIVGARSVKWLEEVALCRSPSTAPWNKHYYLDHHRRDILALPLNSLILSPEEDSQVGVTKQGLGSLTVHGVAYGGVNSEVSAVEVSADGGNHWTAAELLTSEKKELTKGAESRNSWVRFTATLPIEVMLDDKDVSSRRIEVHSRSYDKQGNAQPQFPEKQRTYLYNGWGKTSVVASVKG